MTKTSIGQPARNPPTPSSTGTGPVDGLRDDAGVDEADDGDEQADTDADGGLQGRGDGMEDGLAEAGQHQDGDDDALEDDQSHGIGPGHALLLGDTEGHEGVETKTRRQRQRVVGHHAHEQGHHAGHQGRCSGYHREVGVATTTEEATGPVGLRADDQGVEDDDVGHREERGEAAADLPGRG